MSFGPTIQVGNATIQNPIGFITPIGPRKINEIPLDVVIEESVQHTVVVTEHPIEIGSSGGVSRGTITDHAYRAPSIYTMRGVVSDLPVSWRLFRSDVLTSDPGRQGQSRSITAYQLLFEKHFLELIPFTLKTPWGDMENMLFRTFTVNRDQSTKNALLFSAEMVQLQTVIPDAAKIEPVSSKDLAGDQAQTQAIGEKDLGEVAPQVK